VGAPRDAAVSNALTGFEIAIVGMSGRFPGAHDLETFWRNVRDGVESIAHFSDPELLAAGVPASALNDPRYVKAWGVLEDAALFDAAFFGFTPRDAEITDPQHRLFLECAWEALEDAGIADEVVPVTYMNSSADIKGFVGRHEGVVCTSSNAKRALDWAFGNGSKVAMSAIEQPAARSGSTTCWWPAVRMSADSAMKCTPQNTMYGASGRAAASRASLNESPVTSANWITSSRW